MRSGSTTQKRILTAVVASAVLGDGACGSDDTDADDTDADEASTATEATTTPTDDAPVNDAPATDPPVTKTPDPETPVATAPDEPDNTVEEDAEPQEDDSDIAVDGACTDELIVMTTDAGVGFVRTERLEESIAAQNWTTPRCSLRTEAASSASTPLAGISICSIA